VVDLGSDAGFAYGPAVHAEPATVDIQVHDAAEVHAASRLLAAVRPTVDNTDLDVDHRPKTRHSRLLIMSLAARCHQRFR